MDTINTEKYMNDILGEAKKSSTVRLLREMVRWNDVAHSNELEIIAKEISARITLNKASVITFIICFIMSNIGNAFSEDYYIFDEDEKETRRQLKNDISTHLAILILISCLFLIHFVIALAIIFMYMLCTIILTLNWYRPIHKQLKNINT